MYEKYLLWLQGQQNVLDILFAKAGLSFYEKHKHLDNFTFDANATQKECYLLGGNEDLCYDRFTIGLSYSLWYQGKRTNAFVGYFAKLLFDAREEQEITLLDLGAGTGAVQLAISLCKMGLDALFNKSPEITVINIDTSPFMLDYNRTFLWPEFIGHYQNAQTVKTIYSVNSWEQTDTSNFNNFWITASYLFDQSDNVEHLSENLSKLVGTFEPRYIICNTSRKKGYLMNNASVSIKDQNYEVLSYNMPPLFNGTLPNTKDIRRKIREERKVEYSGNPLWQENWMSSIVLRLTTPSLSIPLESPKVNLFTPPLTVRRDIVLSPEQKKASEDDGRPTVIYGPAGCGKTVVITERVINIIKNHSDQPIEELSILITTFNKELTTVLKDWIEELLKRENINHSRNGNLFYVNGSASYNIRVMHFDTMPYRIWREMSPNTFTLEPNDLRARTYHMDIAKQAIENTKNVNRVTTKKYDHVLTPDYIVDEYEYIIYGQDYNTWEVYANAQRRGRSGLAYAGDTRKILFDTVIEYLKLVEQENITSFITRRHKFLKQIQGNRIHKIFSHLIIDEFQDCTTTDYQIFYGLLKNPNKLIVAGDFAQAVHLGAVAETPRADEEMGNWNNIQLKGSYRLPFRISECLASFSKNIVDESRNLKNPLSPFKGSPPGARPILVFEQSESKMAKKINSIIREYNSYDIINLNVVPFQNILILEKDRELQMALQQVRFGLAYADTVLRIKGLEKRCVLWSTRIALDTSDKLRYNIYTALTRTSGLLIIALFGNECEEYKEIINEFDPKRLIVWDQETKDYLNENYQL